MRIQLRNAKTANCYAVVQMSKAFVQRLKRLLHKDEIQFDRFTKAYAQGGGWYVIHGNPCMFGSDIIKALEKIVLCQSIIERDVVSEMRGLQVHTLRNTPSMVHQIRDQALSIMQDCKAVVTHKQVDEQRTARPATPSSLKALASRVDARHHRG